MVRIHKVSAMIAAVSAAAFACSANAAVIASDTINAGNATYTPAATATAGDALNGLNGGTGFGPWVVTETGASLGNGFAFASSVNQNANDAGNIATRNPAPVFDILDNGGSTITASRTLATPMTAGSSFSFWQTVDALNNTTSNGSTGTVGFQLLDSTGNVLLDLHISGGAAGWTVTDAVNTNLLLVSTDAAHAAPNPTRNLDYNFKDSDSMAISLLDSITLGNGHAGADWQLVTAGHRGDTFGASATQTLQIDMSTGGPTAIAFYNNNGGASSDLTVNSLVESGTAAAPEPATLAVGAMGLSTLLLRRRRAQ